MARINDLAYIFSNRLTSNTPNCNFTDQIKFLAQEVCQKSDISDRRSKGAPFNLQTPRRTR